MIKVYFSSQLSVKRTETIHLPFPCNKMKDLRLCLTQMKRLNKSLQKIKYLESYLQFSLNKISYFTMLASMKYERLSRDISMLRVRE